MSASTPDVGLPAAIHALGEIIAECFNSFNSSFYQNFKVLGDIFGMNGRQCLQE